jgi:hypothetical protein
MPCLWPSSQRITLTASRCRPVWLEDWNPSARSPWLRAKGATTRSVWVAALVVALALALVVVLIVSLYAGVNEGLEHHLFKGATLHSFWNARAATATGRARDPRTEALRLFMHVPRTTGSAMTTHLLAPIPNEASPIWPHEYWEQAIANNGTFLREANRVGGFFVPASGISTRNLPGVASGVVGGRGVVAAANNASEIMQAQVTVKGFFNRRDFLAIEEAAATAGEPAPRAFTILRHPVERLLSLLDWGAFHKEDKRAHVRLARCDASPACEPTRKVIHRSFLYDNRCFQRGWAWGGRVTRSSICRPLACPSCVFGHSRSHRTPTHTRPSVLSFPDYSRLLAHGCRLRATPTPTDSHVGSHWLQMRMRLEYLKEEQVPFPHKIEKSKWQMEGFVCSFMRDSLAWQVRLYA